MMPDLDHWIITAGAVVGALVVIGTAAWKYLISPLYDLGVGDKLDCLAAKLEASAQDTAEQLAKVNGQLRANGGSSLKDQTNRVETQTNRIETTLQQHISGERERTKILAIELKATNRRLAADIAATNARVDRLLQFGHDERVHISEQIVDHDAATTAITKES